MNILLISSCESLRRRNVQCCFADMPCEGFTAAGFEEAARSDSNLFLHQKAAA